MPNLKDRGGYMKKLFILTALLVSLIIIIFAIRASINDDNNKRSLSDRVSDLEEITRYQQIELIKLNQKISRNEKTLDDIIDELGPYQEMQELNGRIAIFTVTGYAPFNNVSGMCTDGDPTRTATGTYPTAGRTIAVDFNVIPRGSPVWVEGFGIMYAEDTGGAIVGNRIDIMFDTYEEAISFGKKRLIVIY